MDHGPQKVDGEAGEDAESLLHFAIVLSLLYPAKTSSFYIHGFEGSFHIV